MCLDEELLSATGGGDPSAFERLVLRHQSRAWAIAYRSLGDPVEAEDAAQEAFLRILEAAPRYRSSASFVTYLTQVVTRLCLDRIRKKRPVRAPELLDVRDESPLPPDTHLTRERGLAVQEALSRLPDRQRMAIVLRHYEDLSYREIASSMGVSRKAVERLLARAREALQRSLAEIVK